MRTEQEMLNLILTTAREDERIRAVILNGSRANPNARVDIFQDFDVVFVVPETDSFKQDLNWIDRFGELMILQLPEEMQDPPPAEDGCQVYLMQFMDGNRIDLTLFPLARLDRLERDSLSILLLDKDGLIEPFPPPDERDYLPQPPTAKQFSDCCNEFWWVSAYAAKGLWRREFLYARTNLDEYMRTQLMKMLVWLIGMRTNFERSPGKLGKHFKTYLTVAEWEQLMRTYADANYEHTWDALESMAKLFRQSALLVAEHFDLAYPYQDDARVWAHLQHVRRLPPDATQMYP
ncbi:MAG: aminoglycoside 6-adenylyltransferase [Anaerolineales bacterium]|nr:aminoglycoside 6-adenylyltransferase [Anaerolineales bacterium]